MNILDKIIEQKKTEVLELKFKNKMSEFKNSNYYNSNTLSFYDALKGIEKLSLIAEVKKASPSKGIIRKDFHHLLVADIYKKNNVSAISVLTDECFFVGNIKFLDEIAIDKTCPLLRKEFIIDEIQIHEAKANGADAILLISEILDKYQIKDYTYLAKDLGMDVLLELHNEKQLDKIDFSVNKIMGVNNRDLTTFDVDISNSTRIAKYFPNEVLVVAESGIKTSDDLKYLKQSRINAVLVGEQFMAAQNIEKALKEFQAGL